MIETVNAIYENGLFRPLNDIHISNGLKVKLIIESENDDSIDDILSLATGVYDGLSEKDISDVEEIALERKDFFKR